MGGEGRPTFFIPSIHETPTQNHTQECVRRRAELSLQVNESCRDRAKAVIDKVFARCYSDTAPFDKIP